MQCPSLPTHAMLGPGLERGGEDLIPGLGLEFCSEKGLYTQRESFGGSGEGIGKKCGLLSTEFGNWWRGQKT